MNKKNGQSIVELAIIMPFILLIIVGGIIDFGFTFFNLITIQQIVDDTAMYAAEGNGTIGVPGSLVAYVESKRPSWLVGTITVTQLADGSVGGGVGSTARPVKRVLLSYDSPLYTPFWQSAAEATLGNQTIPLSVMAAYQVPAVVATR